MLFLKGGNTIHKTKIYAKIMEFCVLRYREWKAKFRKIKYASNDFIACITTSINNLK